MASPNRTCRIALYNHKGGVGKTTLNLNLAWALGELGMRVLVVDSDPQCNLTTYLLDEGVVDDMLDTSDEADGNTIWSALKPLVEADGDFRQIDAIETAAEDCLLLPGDIRLAEFEEALPDLWGDAVQRRLRGYRGISALSALVDRVVADKAIDFVLYDTGPNIGPLNRIVLLDSDFFIVPASCDLFSARATKTLGHTLANWIRNWRLISDLAPPNARIVAGFPRFLGYVPQRFRTYAGQMSDAAASFDLELEKAVTANIVTVLRRIDESLTLKKYPAKLGEVKDFGSLIQLSQRQGVPLALVEGGDAGQKEQASNAFRAIAKAVVNRTRPFREQGV